MGSQPLSDQVHFRISTDEHVSVTFHMTKYFITNHRYISQSAKIISENNIHCYMYKYLEINTI